MCLHKAKANLGLAPHLPETIFLRVALSGQHSWSQKLNVACWETSVLFLLLANGIPSEKTIRQCPFCFFIEKGLHVKVLIGRFASEKVLVGKGSHREGFSSLKARSMEKVSLQLATGFLSFENRYAGGESEHEAKPRTPERTSGEQ